MKLLKVTCLAWIAWIALVTPVAQAADLSEVIVYAGSYRFDDQLGEYATGISLVGFDVAGARILRPGNPATEICDFAFNDFLADGSSDWSCDLFGYASLNEICQNFGFGDFELEVSTTGGGTDLFPYSFDPGCTDPLPGYPDFTSLSNGGTLPPVPGPTDLCWTCSSPGDCGVDAFTAMYDYDNERELSRDFVYGIGDPFCWQPVVCQQASTDNDWVVSSLLYYANREIRTTNSGDAFEYIAIWESQNGVNYNVTGSPPGTSPAVPAGRAGSQPMLGEKVDSSGVQIQLSWDVERCCGLVDHHLIYGDPLDLPTVPGGTYSVDGSRCGLGVSGAATWTGAPTPAPGSFVWWLIVANDGASTEGSWGLDSAGTPRTAQGAGASGQCGMTAQSTANTCGN